MPKKPLGLNLVDIGNPTVNILIGKNSETGEDEYAAVTGVSVKGLLTLFLRFPDLQKFFSGSGVSMLELMQTMPETIAAIIAAGTGTPGDEKAEEIADKLPAEIQLDILQAIWNLTFRSGFGPFVQRLMALAAQAAAIRQDNFGKGPHTKSPPQSKPSSPPDTIANESGTTLPVS